MDHRPDSDAGRRHRGRRVHHHQIHLSRTMTGYETFSIRGAIAWSAHRPRETEAADTGGPPRSALSAAEATQPISFLGPRTARERPGRPHIDATKRPRELGPAEESNRATRARARQAGHGRRDVSQEKRSRGFRAVDFVRERGTGSAHRSRVAPDRGHGHREQTRRAKGICPSAMDGLPVSGGGLPTCLAAGD